LKKRTKKLPLIWRVRVAPAGPRARSKSKSFFASFCSQKEVLPYLFWAIPLLFAVIFAIRRRIGMVPIIHTQGAFPGAKPHGPVPRGQALRRYNRILEKYCHGIT
jgi:hypothetical protein